MGADFPYLFDSGRNLVGNDQRADCCCIIAQGHNTYIIAPDPDGDTIALCDIKLDRERNINIRSFLFFGVT